MGSRRLLSTMSLRRKDSVLFGNFLAPFELTWTSKKLIQSFQKLLFICIKFVTGNLNIFPCTSIFIMFMTIKEAMKRQCPFLSFKWTTIPFSLISYIFSKHFSINLTIVDKLDRVQYCTKHHWYIITNLSQNKQFQS